MKEASNKKTLYLRPDARRIMANAGALRGNTSAWLDATLMRYEAMVKAAHPNLKYAQWRALVDAEWAEEWSAAKPGSAKRLLDSYTAESDHRRWAGGLDECSVLAVQSQVAAYFANKPLGTRIAMTLAGMPSHGPL